MRLLTHNMLALNVRGVTTGYPLKLEATNWCSKEVELNADFIKGLLPKIDWRALVAATRALDLPDLLPEEQPPVEEIFAEGADDVEGSALRRIHHALLEIHVQQGALVCPESGRTFPIDKGIPNMMLHEDEV
jgi:multifunctional methyltransferase subunit TRM112